MNDYLMICSVSLSLFHTHTHTHRRVRGAEAEAGGVEPRASGRIFLATTRPNRLRRRSRKSITIVSGGSGKAA